MLLTSRVSAFLVASLMLVLVTVPILVAGQTSQTTLSNLQYPSQVTLQNGVAQATVTFTVNFFGLPNGDYLVIGVLYGVSPATGSGTETPDSCITLTGTKYANSATCISSTTSSSGTESVSFAMTLNLTQQYNFVAFAAMVTTSDTPINGSVSKQPFSISVTSQTIPTNSQTASANVETTNLIATSQTTNLPTNSQTSNVDFAVGLAVIVLIFIAIIGLVVFVVRRRKGKRTDRTPTEGLTSGTAPAPSAEGTRFCGTCGRRMAMSERFCTSCGSTQD